MIGGTAGDNQQLDYRRQHGALQLAIAFGKAGGLIVDQAKVPVITWDGGQINDTRLTGNRHRN